MKETPEGVEELLTAEEVGQILKVRAGTVRLLVKRGQLPKPLRLNSRVVRWSREDVRRCVERQAEQAQGGGSP